MTERVGIVRSIKLLPKYLNAATIGTGIACGASHIAASLWLYNYGVTMGYSAETIGSWIFSTWGFGAVIGIIMSLRYQMPIMGAWSITGAAITLTGMSAGFSLQQMCVGFLLSGILVLFLGMTGLIKRIVAFLPIEIVMGMTAGCLFKNLNTAINRIYTFTTDKNYVYLFIALLAMVAFFILTKYKQLQIPGMLGSFVVVAVGIAIFGLFKMPELAAVKYSGLVFAGYDFTDVGRVFVSITVPLTLLVIGAENSQAIGIAMAEGYKPPVTAMTIISGVGGIAASAFGGHNANISGPLNGIMMTDQAGEDKDGRYASVIICSVIILACSAFSCYLIPVFQAVPIELLDICTGMSIAMVVLSALREACSSKRYAVPSFFAFAMGISGCAFLGIGTAFWSLIVGVVLCIFFEPAEYKKDIEEVKRNTAEEKAQRTENK